MHVADSMCLPVRLGGVPFQTAALIDQGASRSVMRQSAFNRLVQIHRDERKAPPRLFKIKNMFVIGSTGEYVPIVGRFVTSIDTDDVCLTQNTLIYVVQDKKDNDIICDLVIGRSTIATSRYSCIDTRNTGSLVSMHPDEVSTHHEMITCAKCTFYEDEAGKRQLKMLSSPTCAPPPLPLNSINSKVMKVYERVRECDHLTVNGKAMLHSFLLNHIDSYEFPDIHTSDEEKSEQLNSQSDVRFSQNEGIRICHLMSELDKSIPQSDEEARVVTEIMSTFIPEVVDKPERVMQKRSETSESPVIDEEADEIEFPFTPPTKKDDSPEYHESKKTAITELIRSYTHLKPDQKQSMIKVLMKYADRFSMKGENMERTDSVQHEIDTTDKHPFRERLRQYSPAIQEIIMAEVDSMVKQGVIVPSKSPYASNLLLVRKPDPSSEGGVKNRVCAAFVRLNTQTEKDSYPLPNIQYIFDKIGQSKWFTTMDLLSGFWQVMIKPEHRYKTAFITVRGLYEFVVMPFGLCNAPATFQRLMDAVILPEYRSFIETYIDDLMTHSSTFESHLEHLDVLLGALRKHKLVVKLSKCKFAQQEVKFLGHVISHNKITTNPEAVEAIKKWERPASGGKKAVTAVRGFLGMAGWYRKFIPHFADIAKPLVHLTKNDVKWEWTQQCQSAFEQLRDALTQSPVLAVADPNKNYILHTDASDHAMGAILQQEDENGDKHPIAYASKTFNDAQRNYSVTDREALAIVWALQHFNTYCEGHKYTVLTDHQALSYINKNPKSEKRVTRWQLLLQNYDTVEMKYFKG
jgi:hypothetical protein